MRVYAIYDTSVADIILLYRTREAAERGFADLLRDEPSWQGMLFLMPLDLYGHPTAAR